MEDWVLMFTATSFLEAENQEDNEIIDPKVECAV